MAVGTPQLIFERLSPRRKRQSTSDSSTTVFDVPTENTSRYFADKPLTDSPRQQSTCDTHTLGSTPPPSPKSPWRKDSWRALRRRSTAEATLVDQDATSPTSAKGKEKVIYASPNTSTADLQTAPASPNHKRWAGLKFLKLLPHVLCTVDKPRETASVHAEPKTSTPQPPTPVRKTTLLSDPQTIKPNPKNHRTHAVLGAVADIAKIAGDLAHFFPLQAAGDIARAVLNIKKAVEDNNDDYERIQTRVRDLMEALSHPPSAERALLWPESLARAETLRDSLDEAVKRLEHIRRGHPVKRVVRSGHDAILLQDVDDGINTSIQRDTLQRDLFFSSKLHGITQQVAALNTDPRLSPPPTPSPKPKAKRSRPSSPRLPPRIDFFGRQSEIAHAVRLLDRPESAHVAICGTPGMGKTALATVLLHHPALTKRFASARHFIPCNSATSYQGFLYSIAAHFGVMQPGENPSSDRVRGQLLGLLRSGEGQVPRLLVLDNFETPWEPQGDQRADVEKLLGYLGQVPGLSLIVTLRGSQRPAGVAWATPCLPPLAALDDIAARELYDAISYLPSQSSLGVSLNLEPDADPDIAALLARTANLPLAIHLVAYLISSSETPAGILARWPVERTSMLARGPTSLDATIEVALGSPRMRSCTGALGLLRLLAILPDGMPPSVYKALVAGLPGAALARGRTTLLQTALAVASGAGKGPGPSSKSNEPLRMLVPIREYVAKHQPPAARAHFRVLGAYFAEQAAGLASQDGTWEVRAACRGVGNMQAVVNYAFTHFAAVPRGLEENVCRQEEQDDRRNEAEDEVVLRRAVQTTLDLAVFQQWVAVGDYHSLKLAADVAKRFVDTEPLLYAQCLLRLNSSVPRFIKNPTEAERELSEALALFSTPTHTVENAENALRIRCHADCLTGLGTVHLFQNKQRDALDELNSAIALHKSVGNLAGQAQAHFMLGKVYRRMYDFDSSVAALHCASAIYALPEVDKPAARGACMASLAELGEMRGDLLGAERACRAAMDILVGEAGLELQDSHWHANMLTCLGNICAVQGPARWAEALGHYADAETGHRRQGFVDREADTLIHHAELVIRMRGVGWEEEAMGLLGKAEELWAKVKNVWGDGCLALTRGDYAFALASREHSHSHHPSRRRYLTDASAYYKKAAALFIKCNFPAFHARALLGLARVGASTPSEPQPQLQGKTENHPSSSDPEGVLHTIRALTLIRGTGALATQAEGLDLLAELLRPHPENERTVQVLRALTQDIQCSMGVVPS